MLRWTSTLLLVAPVFLLLYALRSGRNGERSAPLRMIFLVYGVAAAAPLLFALLWRLDATRIVIELHGIAFRGNGNSAIRKVVRERRQGSGRIVIGDVASRTRAPGERRFGTLVFQPAAAGGAKGTLTVELPRPEERAGVIGTRNGGLFGAETVQNGDRLCVADTCWTYDEAKRSFTSNDHVTQIPPREAEIPGVNWTFTLPFAAPIAAPFRTWSVDFLAHEIDTIPPDRKLHSFFCYSKPGPLLRFVPMDRDVTLRRGGAPLTSPASFPVDDGDHLSFYTLPADSATFAAPGIAERRSMAVRMGNHSFALDLDTPEIHSLTVAELRALELAHDKEAKTLNVALSMGDAQLVDRSLYFTGLSESVAVEANALFELSRLFPRNLSSTFPIVSPRGPVAGSLGALHWVGASDLAAIRLDVLRPPLLLLVVGVGLLLLKIAAAWNARLTPAQVLLAGAVEVLVGIRLLIGYRAWLMPPHSAEAGELATFAWMALPWMFLAASIPVDRLRRDELRMRGWRFFLADAAPALAGVALSALFTLFVIEERTKWVWLAMHFVVVGVALIRAEEVRAALGRGTERIAAGWRPARARVVGKLATALPQRVTGALRAAARRCSRLADVRTGPIVIAAVSFTIVRVALLLFGFKESLTLGTRISLSVIHIPAAAALQGMFLLRTWQRIREDGRVAVADHIAALAILFFVWGVPAVLTSDFGLALLNVPLFALLYLAVTRQSPWRGDRIPARVLVVLVVLFIAGAPLFRLVLPFIHNEEFLLAAASNSNYARFLHFAAPERLREMATKRGESLAITSAILQSYISSGVFGRGYGHTEVSPHLGDTALRDFAPAVFVAAEWGLAGTVALLLSYLLFTVIGRQWLPWNGGAAAQSRAAPAVAFVAAATITVSSCYMILVNHELVLLTGKNAYLLGLDSAGDVMEMLVLLLVIAYGAAVARGDDGLAMGGSA